MTIKTERLILREMTADDYDALYAVLADSDIMQHYPYTFDEKRVRGWIEKNKERYRIFGFGLWAVCLKDPGGGLHTGSPHRKHIRQCGEGNGQSVGHYAYGIQQYTMQKGKL